MRSNEDPFFSSICDRIGRGTITAEDELFLQSRIQSTVSENSNENFKSGKISIIVTTNRKRNFINNNKLEQLLPNETLYSCNSIDRVMNLPEKRKMNKKLNDNPGKTGNLMHELHLKIGAPVVITTNHNKKKYREDGIVNGARGFVQSIQTKKEETDKVEVIWVVFINPDVGRLYRFDHQHLRKHFNPGHHNATPILPQRKTFKLNFGSIEYQRTNFPLTLAYFYHEGLFAKYLPIS